MAASIAPLPTTPSNAEKLNPRSNRKSNTRLTLAIFVSPGARRAAKVCSAILDHHANDQWQENKEKQRLRDTPRISLHARE